VHGQKRATSEPDDEVPHRQDVDDEEGHLRLQENDMLGSQQRCASVGLSGFGESLRGRPLRDGGGGLPDAVEKCIGEGTFGKVFRCHDR
jgi:hypothetical protein